MILVILKRSLFDLSICQPVASEARRVRMSPGGNRGFHLDLMPHQQFVAACLISQSELPAFGPFGSQPTFQWDIL